jgi:hypothetical protein
VTFTAYPRDVARARVAVAADLARLAMVVAAVVFLAKGDGEAALKAALVLAPSLFARLVRVDPVLDLVFALALFAEAVGLLGDDDTLPHLLLPLLSGPVLYTALKRAGVVPRPAALVTFAGVVGLGVAWELIEWIADAALGTNYSQGWADTRGDLVNDTIAAAASGVLVGVWAR